MQQRLQMTELELSSARHPAVGLGLSLANDIENNFVLVCDAPDFGVFRALEHLSYDSKLHLMLRNITLHFFFFYFNDFNVNQLNVKSEELFSKTLTLLIIVRKK